MYSFTRRARSPRTLIALGLWWAVLAAAYFIVHASEWVVLILGMFSLPAVYEIGANSVSGLEIDGKRIAWHSGTRGGHLPRGQLKSVRLDTRLDLSLRMTLETHQGGKVRLPYECVPAAAEIEAALTAQDIPYARHHFTLMS